MDKIIIFPDIHGRDFWKAPFEKYKNDDNVMFIFLGDYLDPYGFENIDHDKAWKNLEEILKAFSSIPEDRVKFLIGNHDLHYLEYFKYNYGCRRDMRFSEDMEKILKSGRFDVAYEHECGGKRILFTHAGVTKGWAETLTHFFFTNKKVSEIFNADLLNSLKETGKGLNLLWHISWERGGDHNCGSCIWADIHEHLESERWDKKLYKEMNLYQIFGHTLSFPDFDEYFIGDYFAMLDSRCAFVMDTKTGEISKYE